LTPLSKFRTSSRAIFLLAAAAFLAPGGMAQSALPYRDAKLPVDQRVADLLSRMTLEEKIAQLEGAWEKKE